MIEAILLQIPTPFWEAVRVCSVYYCNCLMYAKHILHHHLVIPLLDLIQSLYHSIIIVLVAECPLHVHQQVPHGDVLALIQCAGPFAWVPTETGKDVRAHTSFIILLEEGIYIEAPEHVCHLCPRISRLKDWYIQSCGCQPFLLSTPSVASAPMPASHGLTCSGVSIRVWCSHLGKKGRPSLADRSTLGLWWPSTWSRGPCTGGKPCLGLSPILEVLLSCWGVLATSWLEESDSHAAPADVLWAEFSAQLLSLQWSEAATECCHASIKGRRLMLKWAEHEIHSEKACSMWVRTASAASCPKPQWPCLS